MSQAIPTPRPGLPGVPNWLRFRPKAPPPAGLDEASTALAHPSDDEDRATSRAMIAFAANGLYASFSIALHYGWLDRHSLSFIFPTYHYVGTALFGILLGLALVCRDRWTHRIAWATLALMAGTEVLDAMRLPTPPWTWTRIPFALILLGAPLLWLLRRKGRGAA